MARVAKDPEVRRNELIETAEQFFVTKGFENTLVSDIVKKLGVAQGTFYYYFKSKDEVMIAILEKKWGDFAAHAIKACESSNTDPLQKLQTVFYQLFSGNNLKDAKMGILGKLSEGTVYDKFHKFSDDARIKNFGPIIQRIVNDGMKQGVFNSMEYPDEITEIIFMGINTYMHTYYPHFNDFEVFKRKMAALEELFEKVLGVKKGIFKLTN